MEVHAHSHSSPTGSGAARKKWTHYLWEFLMLFLAITLGFFVENQREHYVEHQREKQYAKSLYDDLKNDTQVINRTYHEKKWAGKKVDSLERILASGKIAENNELIYYFERFLTRKDIFTSQDVTYRQLLSSGNFRYFGNVELYKAISDYYNLYDRYHALVESPASTFNDLSQLEVELFDPTDLNSLYDPEARIFYNLFNRPDGSFRMIKINEKALDRLQIYAGNARYENEGSAQFLGWMRSSADSIIRLLKEEYHLKE